MTAPFPLLIAQEAMTWVGTPFVHLASVKGSGCDCLGLIKGVYEAVLGVPQDPLPVYPQDFWRSETWHHLFLSRLSEVAHPSGESPAAGHLLLFAKKGNLVHLGIAVDKETMVHTSSDPRVMRVTHGPFVLANGLSLWGVWQWKRA